MVELPCVNKSPGHLKGANVFSRVLRLWLCLSLSVFTTTGCSRKSSDTLSGQANSNAEHMPLKMAISPYQEIAMLVNEKPLGLEKKYDLNLELITMPWEEQLPAVASAGPTVDVGFASLSDYLAKADRINSRQDDPVLYLFPSWTFHGGGFISFNAGVPKLDSKNINDKQTVEKFLGYKFGAQKFSPYHMLLWKLAKQVGMKLSSVNIVDTTLNEGLLATENGSLDMAGVGLTQRTEAVKRHGRVVLTMDTVHLMDPSGFICKKSVYLKRKREIDALIHIWYDCTNYVLSDLDHHSDYTLDYLKKNSSTHYSLSEFKEALAQEYVPKSIAEAKERVGTGTSEFSIASAAKQINEYLVETGAIKTPAKIPEIIDPQ
jgi:ABC-type nitrate/sulfonate/bicarbonate transport system substrate-binding protein